jgi:hypothetical protein
LEPPGHEEESKTKDDLEEVNYGGGTERMKDVEGGEEVGSRQVVGKASWKPFAPIQEIIGSDDDDGAGHDIQEVAILYL